MGWTWLLLALCAAIVLDAGVDSANPGFKLRITKKGLDYANQQAVSALSRKIRTMHIPRKSGGSGKFSYEIRNLRVTRFNPPTSQISLVPGHGLRWSMRNADVAVRADFKASKKVWFVRLRTSGIITADASRVSISVDLKMGKDSRGRPTIRVSRCSGSLGSIKVKVRKTGFFNWLYNLLLGAFRGKIRRLLEDQICKTVTKTVNDNFNRKLAALPVQRTFLRKFVLDYRLLSPPTFTSRYLETSHKGVVYWKGEERNPPFTCPALPRSYASSRMVYLWVSQYLANSMAYAAFRHNYLRYNVHNLPKRVQRYLRTSCGSDVCLGSLFPQVALKYPKSQAGLALYATRAPTVRLRGGLATVRVAGKADLAVSSSSLFSLDLDLTLSFSATVRNDRVVLRIKKIVPKISVSSSSVGNLPMSNVNRIIQLIIDRFLIPHLNARAAEGMPLPLTRDIHLVNHKLAFVNNALMIATDLSYRP